MSFQAPLTIKEVIENIHKKKYLLQSIQREFVWNTDQVERLFDSLMQGYPVGSFLFWYVNKEKSKEFQFYEFVRNYHERDHRHNPNASISGEEDIIAILDGQQRLTSLYIGLKGSYAIKIPRMRRDNVNAYPNRNLYLDLLSSSDDFDTKYDFRFLTDEEADDKDEDAYWFKVGNILDIKEPHLVNEYLIENGLNILQREKALFANQSLFRLHKLIHDQQNINYYLEKEQNLDKVLNIFIRVNSGGTKLSYSDLLLSIATAQWIEKDARKEITEFVDNINKIGYGFNFDKDFVLKSCLVLNDFNDIAFKVDNFTSDTMQTIEKNWVSITKAIRLAIELVSSFGFNEVTLTSANAIIPIAYYILKKNTPHNFVISSKFAVDRQLINKWLLVAILKRVFSGQPDEVLRPLRKIISTNHEEFPLNTIVEEFKGRTKSFSFNDDEISNLLSYQYGQKHTFSLLALLYPTLIFKNIFHLDHIFAKSLFTKKNLLKNGVPENNHEFYIENCNIITNLQLLEGTPNIEKMDMLFDRWIIKAYPEIIKRKEYMDKNYIPTNYQNITDFEQFISARQQLMFIKLKSILY